MLFAPFAPGAFAPPAFAFGEPDAGAAGHRRRAVASPWPAFLWPAPADTPTVR